MNSLERFHASVNYQNKDRIMYWGFPIRESTRHRWHKEGLPESIDCGGDVHDYFGFDRWDHISVHIHSRCWPEFEPVIIEETDTYKIWIDELGTTRKDFKEIENPGFVTRSYLRFPVENRQDFLKMQPHFNPDDKRRFSQSWPVAKSRYPQRDYPIEWIIPGFFWLIRDWMGFYNTCLAFYDQPDLVREMVEFITDYNCRLIRNVMDDDDVEVDLLVIGEDMAYKNNPMISPQMCRDFLLDGYRRINDTAKQYGTKYIVVDCDGYSDPLIPVWLEAGFDGIYPMEVAAGVDAVKLRKEYGRKLLMFGNVDKRQLAKGPDAIDREVGKKIPLALEGGYIIGVDHAVPPDISFDNYLYYVKTLRRLGGRQKS